MRVQRLSSLEKAVAILKDAITKKRQVNYCISERCVQGVFRKIRVQEVKNRSVTKEESVLASISLSEA